MKKFLLILLALAPSLAFGQKVGLKTNVLYDATATINLGLEFALGGRTTMDISGNYNGWKFDDFRLKHWSVQPEFRIWVCEKFNGSFFGIHAHYAQFNVGGFPNWSFVSKNMQEHRYQGDLYGAGISYGYQWVISDHWNIEATLGVGYARINYDKYPIAECGSLIKSSHRNYWGPTKVGVSFIWIIK